MKHRLPFWMTHLHQFPTSTIDLVLITLEYIGYEETRHLMPQNPPIKRFFVFAWHSKPKGGWLDYHSGHVSLVQAEATRTLIHSPSGQSHIVDREKKIIIAQQVKRSLPVYSFLPAFNLTGLTRLLAKMGKTTPRPDKFDPRVLYEKSVPAGQNRAAKECPSVRPRPTPARTVRPRPTTRTPPTLYKKPKKR